MACLIDVMRVWLQEDRKVQEKTRRLQEEQRFLEYLDEE